MVDLRWARSSSRPTRGKPPAERLQNRSAATHLLLVAVVAGPSGWPAVTWVARLQNDVLIPFTFGVVVLTVTA